MLDPKVRDTVANRMTAAQRGVVDQALESDHVGAIPGLNHPRCSDSKNRMAGIHVRISGHSIFAVRAPRMVQAWNGADMITFQGFVDKTMLGDEPHEMNHMFGLVALIAVVALGALGGIIGLKWPKPWGVVVERKGVGFDKLFAAPSKDAAVAAAAAINKALGH